MGSLTAPEMLQLSRSLRPILWLLTTSISIDKENLIRHWTGFSVNNKGMILTTMSNTFIHIKGCKSASITARRIDMDVTYDAHVVHKSFKWDIMLLQVNIDEECQPGILASNGCVVQGENLLTLCQSLELVGTLAVGRASYACADNNPVNLSSDIVKCSNYFYNPWGRTLNRVMGHVWNRDVFVELKTKTQDIPVDMINFYKNMHPWIPIIQCHGFPSFGCFGAPIFNTRKEIVGMLQSRISNQDVALHVSILREFLNMVDNKEASSSHVA